VPTAHPLAPRLGAVLLLLPALAAAQGTPIYAATRREVVDTLAAQLERAYVAADTGRLIARRLRERLAAGGYQPLTTADGFADAVTTDLRSINGDLHLSLMYAPDAPALPAGPHALPTPRPTPPGTHSPDEPEPTAAMLAGWRAQNFGLARAAILEGNVGYLEVHGFFSVPEAYATAEAALAFLERTDAMIFDLTQMPGGSGDMSNWLISHFTGPDSLPGLAIVNRSAGDSIVRWTLAKVGGKKRPDVPVYVLVSRGTASAGEDFAFVLQNLGRATLVGERTAGAGHNNAMVSVGYGFVASVSYTRVLDPRTGREWERVGVRPDVATAPERALETAHALAVRELAARTADPQRKRILELTAQTLAARANPHRVPAKLLARYAGTYGERVVSVGEGGLTFRRIPYPPQPLVPLDDSTFALATVERLTLLGATAGRPRLRLVRSRGDTVQAERTGPVPPAAR